MRKLYLTLGAVLMCCCTFLSAQHAPPTRDDLREQGILAEPGEMIVTETVSADGQAVLKTDACASAFVLPTFYATNNGQRGAMFDIYATNASTILCFDFNLYSGTTAPYEIYYRPGTWVGNENNSGAWTFVGSVASLTSLGSNVPTPIPIAVNVTIPQGQRYAFYVTNTSGGGLSYTDGTAAGNLLASDANITVYEGIGKSYPFGITFNPRSINAHIYYDAVVLDDNSLDLTASAGHSAIQLNMTVSEAGDYDRYELMRAENGGDYRALSQFEGSLPSSFEDADVIGGALYMYRLDAYTPDGTFRSSPVVSASLAPDAEWSIASVSPNPFAEGVMLNLYLANEEQVEISISNLLGQEVLHETRNEGMGYRSIELNTANLESGMYLLRVSVAGKSKTVRLMHH